MHPDSAEVSANPTAVVVVEKRRVSREAAKHVKSTISGFGLGAARFARRVDP